jgi:hypothetical protein
MRLVLSISHGVVYCNETRVFAEHNDSKQNLSLSVIT